MEHQETLDRKDLEDSRDLLEEVERWDQQDHRELMVHVDHLVSLVCKVFQER